MNLTNLRQQDETKTKGSVLCDFTHSTVEAGQNCVWHQRLTQQLPLKSERLGGARGGSRDADKTPIPLWVLVTQVRSLSEHSPSHFLLFHFAIITRVI